MKIRTAWMERDMMYLQIEIAKAQVIARNWPTDFTVDDRKLTVQEALKDADIDHRFVAISTTEFNQIDKDDPQKTISQLSNITVIQFLSFEDRKKFLNKNWDHRRAGAGMAPFKWENNPTEEEVEEQVTQEDGSTVPVSKMVKKDHWHRVVQDNIPSTS